jgi:hypothetical protein
MTSRPLGWWKKSRLILSQLFEGYYKDYGQEEGEKIIRAIIDVLGGCRLKIPRNKPKYRENIEALLDLYRCFAERFGQASGEAIMRKFLAELKGCRISFPGWEDLYIEERNRRIQAAFTGNYTELALRFGLHVRHIWRIVNKYDKSDKKSPGIQAVQ